MDNILINIGNTHTHFATLNCEVFLTADSKDVMGSVERADFGEAYCACVLPAAAEALKKKFGDRIHFLAAEDITGINFSQVNVSTTGADRLANLLGIHKKFPGETVLVLDCGTCVTGELLAGTTFRGGFIHPGRRLQRQALEDHTGALPKVSLTAVPPELTGTDTVSSIMSGIDNVSLLGIQGLSQKLKVEYPELKTVLTGGDAAFYAHAVSEAVIIPDLTLQGLAAFASFD